MTEDRHSQASLLPRLPTGLATVTNGHSHKMFCKALPLRPRNRPQRQVSAEHSLVTAARPVTRFGAVPRRAGGRGEANHFRTGPFAALASKRDPFTYVGGTGLFYAPTRTVCPPFDAVWRSAPICSYSSSKNGADSKNESLQVTNNWLSVPRQAIFARTCEWLRASAGHGTRTCLAGE